MATDFPKGALVVHASMGLGKVIELEPEHIHIYFLDHPSAFATKLKLSIALPLLRLHDEQTHGELDALPLFLKEAGRFRLKRDVMTFDQALKRFRDVFPDAFGDAAYREAERDYKVAAHRALQDAFGNGRGAAMLAAGSLKEVVETALRIERKTNLTHPQFEKPRLADALRDDEAATTFFTTLFQVVDSPQPNKDSFESLIRVIDTMPTPGGPLPRWPATTIFPALLRPDAFIFFRPTFTQEAALRLAFELNYKPEPNWTTYKSVLDFAHVLFNKLKPYGAQDLIDVQSFIYVTASGTGYNR